MKYVQSLMWYFSIHPWHLSVSVCVWVAQIKVCEAHTRSCCFCTAWNEMLPLVCEGIALVFLSSLQMWSFGQGKSKQLVAEINRGYLFHTIYRSIALQTHESQDNRVISVEILWTLSLHNVINYCNIHCGTVINTFSLDKIQRPRSEQSIFFSARKITLFITLHYSCQVMKSSEMILTLFFFDLLLKRNYFYI